MFLIHCVMHAGCFIAPLTFQMYWRSFPIGDLGGLYKAPYANVYRGMAILGTQVRQIGRPACGQQCCTLCRAGPTSSVGASQLHARRQSSAWSLLQWLI